jgi:Polysulphide reductase, NrfD
VSASANDDVRSYYGRPILKEPVWKKEVPWYLFAGGLAGASSSLAAGARLSGNDHLARSASLVAFAGVVASPPLLIKDLGRPLRFYNMLRVLKVTSPMSIGTWILSVSGTLASTAAACELLGILPTLKRSAQLAGGVVGLPLCTYTGALLSDTAIPVWHEARRELPLLFAGGAAASAGGAAALFTPPEAAKPARRLGIAGAALELATTFAMERRLGDLLAGPYRDGDAKALARSAKALTAAGGVLMALAGRGRLGAAAAGTLLLGGSACGRWAVFKAGFESARDPKHTVVPQRERARRRGSAATTVPS